MRALYHHFQQQAQRTPAAIAIQFETTTLTYAALDVAIKKLSAYLTTLGVGSGDRIALYIDRSERLPIVLMAILKMNAVYIPFDISYPAARINTVLDDVQPKYVFTQRKWSALFANKVSNTVILEDIWENLNYFDKNASTTRFNPNALAYILYTSGSTGQPKGVKISQKAMMTFLSSMVACDIIHQKDILLAITTISFDIAVLELFLPLMVGATIIITTHKTATDGQCLKKMLAQHSITLMQATPTTWRLLVDSGWQGNLGLKMLCGGEALTDTLRQQLLTRGQALWNCYGPTEATVWASIQAVQANEPISIGRPLRHATIYVLDEALKPVASGDIGEIFIGGEALAEGYHQRDDLTQECFIDNPFDNGQTKLYKTGDLARYYPNGKTCFIGRTDSQVKIRGFRIELGEIENALLDLPNINHAVVTVNDFNPDDQRITAYMITKNQEKISTKALKTHLLKILPHYMQPSYFIQMPHFPLTANNKIDKNALPKPKPYSNPHEFTGDIPRTLLQKSIAKVWKKYLKTNNITLNDNFFDLGGHSLLAVKVIADLRTNDSLQLSIGSLLYNNLGQIAAGFENDPLVTNPSILTQTAFYFSSDAHKLFGYLHHNKTSKSKMGVVLCYPMGQEYIRAHRAFKVLATRLAQHDFPTLRFDYYGCGDAEGNFNQASLVQWKKDIVSAAFKLKEMTHCEKIVLIGARLGASLAFDCGISCGTHALGLWDPVVDGAAYLTALQQEQHKIYTEQHRGSSEMQSQVEQNILGFPLGSATQEELHQLDLITIKPPPHIKVLPLYSNRSFINDEFDNYLMGLEEVAQPVVLDETGLWLEAPDTSIVPHAVIEKIINWLRQIRT